MDERLKFIARLLDGEKMAVVCRAFGISRKTGDNGADGGTRTPTPVRGADFHTTSTFAAASPAFVVWTIPSP